MRRITTRTLFTAGALALGLTTGCPPEDSDPDVVPDPTNNFNNSATNNETNNATNNATNNTSGSNNETNNATNNATNNTNGGDQDACGNVQEQLGLSPSAGTLTWSGSTTNEAIESAYLTSCGFGMAPEASFAFSFTGPVQLKFNVSTIGPTRLVHEVLEGTCEAQGATRFCASRDQVFVAEGDKEYILVVEPEANQARGEFTVEVEVEPLVCLPVGQSRCEGNDIKVCSGGGKREDTITCGAPCEEGVCGGDLCTGAIELTSADFPYSFRAPADGYGSNITFEGDNTCANPDRGILPGGGDEDGDPDPGDPGGDSDPSLPTPGQDVSFMLKSLTQGQKVTIDASAAAGDAADSAIFILEACDITECLFAKDLGDVVTEWEVPADGDYLVIVDRVSSSDQDLGVDINVQ